MEIDIFNKIHWLNFRKLPEINLLPLNEQVKKYNLYINEFTYQRNVYLHWLEGHKKGVKTSKEDNNFFIEQENGEYLLQENGSKLIWN
tara:strand:- start:1914 stop:2177 length:264 start_codon:yes stop_codon:yes gene_type:complete